MRSGTGAETRKKKTGEQEIEKIKPKEKKPRAHHGCCRDHCLTPSMPLPPSSSRRRHRATALPSISPEPRHLLLPNPLPAMEPRPEPSRRLSQQLRHCEAQFTSPQPVPPTSATPCCFKERRNLIEERQKRDWGG
jgi:hypothetical protein